MKNINASTVFLAALMGAPLVVSCASKPDNYQALSPSADPAGELATLNADLAAAQKNQVDVLAPKAFRESTDTRDHATRVQASNKDNEKVLEAIAISKAYLVQAEQRAAVARDSLGAVTEARSRAIEAGALQADGDRFHRADKKLQDYAKGVEKGQVKISVENKEKMKNEYRELERLGMREHFLGRARKDLDQAKKEGAEKVSPRTWESALHSFAVAENSINQNPTEQTANASLSELATLQAAKVLQITRDAKLSKKRSPEEMALMTYNQKDEIALLEQEKNRAESAKAQAEAERKASEARLGSQVEGLEGELATDRKIASVRQQFSPEEADVFKDGDKVLIRVKQASFDTNRATLRSDQLSLLSKIQKAVAEVQPDKVVVEGHTDSTGGKKLNQSLSEERANIVREYLVTNGALKAEQVDAKGFGYDRPLRSNKTPEGRKENRRIDIVMEM